MAFRKPQGMTPEQEARYYSEMESPTLIRGFRQPAGLGDDPMARARYYEALDERSIEAAEEPLDSVMRRYGLDSRSAYGFLNSIMGSSSTESQANRDLARLYQGYHAAETPTEKRYLANKIGVVLDEGNVSANEYTYEGTKAGGDPYVLRRGLGLLPDALLRSKQERDPLAYEDSGELPPSDRYQLREEFDLRSPEIRRAGYSPYGEKHWRAESDRRRDKHYAGKKRKALEDVTLESYLTREFDSPLERERAELSERIDRELARSVRMRQPSSVWAE
tara:strand:- start:118 stop:948 length:831 start_codon:yes stop_codon:yes gene_type:complete